MVHYKLTYFDLRGLGEVARLILHYANVEFEDHRITLDEWQAIKPTTPFGQLPVLTIDGKIEIAQSFAIARYLAKQYGLAGSDDIESAQLDAIADLNKDFINESRQYFAVVLGREQGDKQQLYNDVLLPAIEKFFPFFVKLLKVNGNKFFAKSGISWVDFFIASGIQNLKKMNPEVLEKYSELLEHFERVQKLPQLQKYLKTRKETDV